MSEEQCPVDISKTGITLINNMVGLLPVGIAAYAKGEIDKLPFLRLQGGPQESLGLAIGCAVLRG